MIYSKKFFDFVKSSIFYDPLRTENRTEIAAILAHDHVFAGQGSGDYCDITSRTRQFVFRTISDSLLVYVWRFNRSILVANSRNMPHRYVVGGCDRFVRQKRAGWDPSKSSVICSNHFKAGDSFSKLHLDNWQRSHQFLTDNWQTSVPYLVRDSFVFTTCPTVHVGELKATKTLSDRDKRMILRLRSSSSLAFISYWYLSNHSASASG